MIEQVNLKEERIGIHAIENFTVTEEQANLFNLRKAMSSGGFVEQGREVYAGTYTRLVRFDNNSTTHGGRTVVMSDTHAERKDHELAVKEARGLVAISGLGLGMVVQACLAKPEVEHVIVIEKSPEVIALTAKYYEGERCTVINESAFDFEPPEGKHFGMVWHDIWDDISDENLPEMEALFNKWAGRTDWQGAWCWNECNRIKTKINEALAFARLMRNRAEKIRSINGAV